MDIRYRYRDTEFLLKEKRLSYSRPYFEVTGLASYKEEVHFPAEVNGYEVRGLRFSPYYRVHEQKEYQHQYPGITKLIFHSPIKIYSMDNICFPDLEEVVFHDKQEEYEFSDRMLYDESGGRLLLTLGRGMHADEIRIPSKVRKIASRAFWDTEVRKIVFSYP